MLSVKSFLAFGSLFTAITFSACQPEVEDLGMDLQPASVETAAKTAAIPFEGIQFEKNLLAFASEKDFMVTLENLVAAEQEQTSEGDETHPGLASFESNFRDFTSQRVSIRQALHNTEYTQDNIPGSDAVQSPAILAMLNGKGQVKVAGTIFTFTNDGILGADNEVVAGYRSEGDCCFRWSSHRNILAHSRNQFLVGNTYIYSWSFFGSFSIFVKGTTSHNYILAPFLAPYPAESLRADPVASFYRVGSCAAETQWFDIGANFISNGWYVTKSGVKSNAQGLPIYNAESDIHFTGVRQYGTYYSMPFYNCL